MTLVMHQTYVQAIRAAIQASRQGATVDRQRMIVTWPDGRVQLFGYGDAERYISCTFEAVSGTNDPQLLRLVR